MKDEAELFARLEGKVFAKINGKYYEVRELKTIGKAKGLQKQTLICYDAENKKQIVFRLNGEKLLQPYIELLDAEHETGLRQILMLDLDTGEWAIYPITAELVKKCPFLREKREYVV